VRVGKGVRRGFKPLPDAARKGPANFLRGIVMNSAERKCLKDATAGLTKAALAHDRREGQHRENEDSAAADCHKDAAAGCRASAMALTKAASLPSGSQGSDGEHSDVELNLTGDSQAKRSTEEIDALLQKDRSAEFGKTPITAIAADPIAELAHQLSL